MSSASVTVRMYHVGFGDAFLVTVADGRKRWRMLIDCGVHTSGVARPLDSVVSAIIADIGDASGGHGLDVVVATHRHADHIAGFANEAWDSVGVGGVWLPWVEDPSDPDAQELQRESDAVAAQLVGLGEQALTHAERRDRPVSKSIWSSIVSLAANASVNREALTRLRGETDGFVDPDAVRYLSNDADDDTVVATPLPGVRVHVVGPSRNRDVLRRMNPPKSSEWISELAMIAANGPDASRAKPLFDSRYELPEELISTEAYETLHRHRSMLGRLHQIGDDEALLAASKLEQWCNNTSLFLVLEVGSRRLVFPGDTQQGGWQHVLSRAHTLELIKDADFYKVSHHGSHNGTPQEFIDDVLGDSRSLMLPFSPVKQWKKIPVKGLIDAFATHQHRLACGVTDYRTDTTATLGPEELWSEVSL